MSGPHNRLELKQAQRLALSPVLQQSIGILALTGPSLEEFIAQAAAENPFLIYTPFEGEGFGSGQGSSQYELALQSVAARPSLGEHLSGQIALMDLADDVAEAARRLAYDLDGSGFFTQENIAEVAREHGLSEAIAGLAVRALQSCEPTGVAAFNLLQSIRLQLAESGLPPARVELVLAGLPYFSKGQTEMIGPALGLGEQEAREIAALVRSLDPAPGRAFDLAEPVVRVPELLVTETASEELSVELVNDQSPRLRLDKALMNARGEKLATYLAEAKALISAVRYRGKTLLEVGKAVVDAQAAFFTGRSEALAPLTRVAIAEEVALHKSTVGRAIAGKTLIWRGRIIEIERLFPATLAGDPDVPASSHKAQLAITRLVSAEEPGAVLSDEDIREKLRQDGVDIARRTVAKYRKWLNIPSSSKRRRLLTQSADRRRTR